MNTIFSYGDTSSTSSFSLYIYILSFNNTVYFMSNLINYIHEYLFASLPYSMDLIIIIIIIIIICFLFPSLFF